MINAISAIVTLDVFDVLHADCHVANPDYTYKLYVATLAPIIVSAIVFVRELNINLYGGRVMESAGFKVIRRSPFFLVAPCRASATNLALALALAAWRASTHLLPPTTNLSSASSVGSVDSRGPLFHRDRNHYYHLPCVWMLRGAWRASNQQPRNEARTARSPPNAHSSNHHD